MRGVFLILALSVPALLPAQLVRGRVLEAGGGPIPRAIIELRRPGGEVVNRSVTGPAGAFALSAPATGRYWLRVAAIGYTPTQAPMFEVPTEGITLGDIQLARVAVTLAELEVLGASRCGQGADGSGVLSRLLDGARTSLDVMRGTLGAGDGAFRVELVHRVSRTTRRDSLITADTVATALRWPIESIDPDSIRTQGFMMSVPDQDIIAFRWFGPDVRVLFADWFLESHCFRVERRSSDTTAITVVFDPVPSRGRVDIGGTMVLDPGTLALRMLTFEHRNLPRPFRVGTAGGEIRFAELPSGTWLPTVWRIFAPIQSNATGQPIGIDERSGRVVGSGLPGQEMPAPRPRTEDEE